MQKHEPKKVTKYEKHRFIEEHKEEILADIGRLPQGEVLNKWGIGSNTYYQLSKGMIRVKAEAGKRPGAKAQSKPDEVVELTEHERYLVLLGYQQAVREFLKSVEKLVIFSEAK